MGQNRILELASTIESYVKSLGDTFGEKTNEDIVTQPKKAEIAGKPQQTKVELLGALSEMESLVEGPMAMVMRLTGFGVNIRPALHAITKFKLANTFPTDETSTYAKIASVSGLDEADVKRILRMAMTFMIFAESSPGVVEHTAASRLLAENEIFRAWVENALDVIMPSAYYMSASMEKWPKSQEPTHTAFNFMTGKSDPMFIVLNQDPVQASNFAKSMKMFTESPPFSHDHLVNNFGWDKVNTIVDVGGSNGHVSIAIARKYPEVKCVVQDQESTIKQVSAPTDVAERIEYMAHDFFRPQPVKGADVYLIRWVLNNWSDLYAVKIIRALVPAMQAGSKVVVSNACLPDISSVPLYQQRNARSHDLVMKQMQNGRERDREDWKMLFETADPRFGLDEIIEPPGSALAIIVFTWNVEGSRQ